MESVNKKDAIRPVRKARTTAVKKPRGGKK